MQTQTLALLLYPTQEDLWKVFKSVHTYPTPMPDVMRDAGVPTLRFYGALIQLEENGLIVQHAHTSSVVEWILADA